MKTINENYKSKEIDNEMNEIYKSLGNQIKDSTLEVYFLLKVYNTPQ